jgi:hypothetical protein
MGSRTLFNRDDPGRGKRGMRVFLGPVEIAGYYSGIERGLRSVGIDAVAIDLNGHPFKYARVAGSTTPLAARLSMAAVRLFRLPVLRRLDLARKLVIAAATVPLFLWALVRFDVFVFGFRTSFFGLREVPLLHRLGKRLVFVFHGSDARPPYMDGADMSEAAGLSIADCANLAARKRRDIGKIERYANLVICHPLYGHFFQRPYVRWSAIGMPFERPVQTSSVGGRVDQSVRALHSPSNPAVKGTTLIRRAVAAVQSRGVPLEFREVLGLPNAVVLDEIAKADFVIDQLYSDIPMATFATEAAWQARPAVVGSYGWHEMQRLLPPGEHPPVKSCHPDDVAEAIASLAMDRATMGRLGDEAFQFVSEHWSDAQIVDRFLRVLTGDIPPEWLSDPREISYRHGCGLPESRARSITRAVIEEHGRAALQLGDKPDLEASIVDWATAEGNAPDRLPYPPADATVVAVEES